MRFLFILFVISIFCTGCNPGVRWIKINGKITLDGVPIDRGVIKFDQNHGDGPSGGGAISNGTYVAKVVPGMNVVRVSGENKTSTAVPDPDHPGAFIDYAPATDEKRHWNESEYVIEINPKERTYDIDLSAAKH